MWLSSFFSDKSLRKLPSWPLLISPFSVLVEIWNSYSSTCSAVGYGTAAQMHRQEAELHDQTNLGLNSEFSIGQ
jgi:hypothetical protein